MGCLRVCVQDFEFKDHNFMVKGQKDPTVHKFYVMLMCLENMKQLLSNASRQDFQGESHNIKAECQKNLWVLKQYF